MRTTALFALGMALLPAIAVAQGGVAGQGGTTPSGSMPPMPNLGTPQAQANMSQQPPSAVAQPTTTPTGQQATMPTPELNQKNTPVSK